MAWRVWWLLAGTGVFLGAGVPLARWAAQGGVEAVAFTLWPTLVAGAVLAGVGWARQGLCGFSPRWLAFGLLAGLGGHALPMWLSYWLAAHAGAGFAALSFTLSPLFTWLILIGLGLERAGWRRALAIASGLAGGVLLIGGQGLAQRLPWAFGALALAVPVLIAATNVYRSQRMPSGAGAPWLAGLTLLGSALWLLVGSGLGDGLPAWPATTVGLTAALLQVAALVSGYLCYFGLQRAAEPVVFSFIGYVMTAMSLALGVAVWQEPLPWTVWPALMLVALGLRGATRTAPRAREAA